MSRQIDSYDMPEEYSLDEEVPQNVPTPWSDRKADELLYGKTERFYALLKEAKLQIGTSDMDDTQSFSYFVRFKYRLHSEEYSPLESSDFEHYLNRYLSDKRYNNNGKVKLPVAASCGASKLNSL